MNYEDRLQKAKQEKSLTVAPALRRVVMLTRWFGLIGGIFLMIFAIRGIIAGAGILEDTPVPLLVAVIEVILAVSIFTLSRMTNSAAGKYDMGGVFTALGRLKAVLIADLGLVILAVIYLVSVVSDAGLNPLPFVIPSIAHAILVSIWIREIGRGRMEILRIGIEGGRMPENPMTPPAKRTKTDYLRHFSLIAAVSAVFSAMLSAVFWYLASHRLDFLTEHFTDKPLGLIEPFEVFQRYQISKGSEPLWNQWGRSLYAEDTGQSAHQAAGQVVAEPYGSEPSEEDAAFNTYMNENSEIHEILNRRVFFFDFTAYFALFSVLGTGAGILLGFPRHAAAKRKASPPPP